MHTHNEASLTHQIHAALAAKTKEERLNGPSCSPEQIVVWNNTIEFPMCCQWKTSTKYYISKTVWKWFKENESINTRGNRNQLFFLIINESVRYHFFNLNLYKSSTGNMIWLLSISMKADGWWSLCWIKQIRKPLLWLGKTTVNNLPIFGYVTDQTSHRFKIHLCILCTVNLKECPVFLNQWNGSENMFLTPIHRQHHRQIHWWLK